MNRREKAYIWIIILLILILVTKSVYLDDYKPQNREEELFKEYSYGLAVEETPSLFKSNKFRTFRVVDIKKIENGDASTMDEDVSMIKIYDEKTGKQENIEIEGMYKAKIRKYILGVMPYGEFSILSRQ